MSLKSALLLELCTDSICKHRVDAAQIKGNEHTALAVGVLKHEGLGPQILQFSRRMRGASRGIPGHGHRMWRRDAFAS